jgi:hypothetical protein
MIPECYFDMGAYVCAGTEERTYDSIW